MRITSTFLTLVAVFLFTGAAIAADKVVVIPLNSSSQPNWINLSVTGAFLENGAALVASNEVSGIWLTATGVPEFTWEVMLPPNYKTGKDLTVHIRWSPTNTNCDYFFVPRLLTVIRMGTTPVAGSSSPDGLSIVGGNVVSAGSVFLLGKEIIATITPPTSLQPLDSLLFGFGRLGGDAADTCTGGMIIQGAYISY